MTAQKGTFTYSCAPATYPLDEIRFLVQDTVEEKALLWDQEINYILAKYGSTKIDAVCAACCSVILMHFARESDVRVSNYNAIVSAVFQKYKAMEKHFRANAITSAHFVVPSISKVDKELYDDYDLYPAPFFKRGLFDNPQATDPITGTDDNLDDVLS